MNSAEAAEITERVRGYVEKWKPLLNLHNWVFVLKGVDEPDSPHTMSMNWVPNYHTATLEINLGVPNPEVDFDIICEEVVVHELCHIVLADIHDLVDQECAEDGVLYKLFARAFETQVENLAAIALKLQKDSDASTGTLSSLPTLLLPEPSCQHVHCGDESPSDDCG